MKHISRYFGQLVGLHLVLAAGAGGSQTLVEVYWPLHDGDQETFTYANSQTATLSVSGMGGGQFNVSLSAASETQSLIVEETPDGAFLSEVDVSGMSITLDPAILLFNDELLKNGGSPVTITTVTQPGLDPYPATFTSTIGKAGTVKVPAGTFADCRSYTSSERATIPGYGTMSASALTAVFAPNVGIVKVRVGPYWAALASATIGGVTIGPGGMSQLVVECDATAGSVSPDYNGQSLQTGNSYTMTATPKPGNLFADWTDGRGAVLATTAKLTFVMRSNLVLVANFVPNPFPPFKGTYAGLFYPKEAVSPGNSGSFTTTLSAQGGLSSQIVLGASTYRFSGAFSPAGTYSNSLPRSAGQGPLLVCVQLDFASGQITNSWVSDGSWTSPLLAFRVPYSSANKAPEAGRKYTLMIERGSDAAVAPAGYGFGTMTVDALGNARFAGTLGDGTKVTQNAPLCGQDCWPLYLSLYSGKGLVAGWLSFSNTPSSDISGAVCWMKQPVPAAKLYPSGFVFTNSLTTVGSLYALANGARALNVTNGVIVVEGGNLPRSITSGFSLGAGNRVTSTNKLSLTFTTSTGLFQGTVPDASGKPIAVSGVLLQKRNAGYGLFLGSGRSGSVWVGGQ